MDIDSDSDISMVSSLGSIEPYPLLPPQRDNDSEREQQHEQHLMQAANNNESSVMDMHQASTIDSQSMLHPAISEQCMLSEHAHLRFRLRKMHVIAFAGDETDTASDSETDDCGHSDSDNDVVGTAVVALYGDDPSQFGRATAGGDASPDIASSAPATASADEEMIDSNETDDAMDEESSVDSTDSCTTDGEGDDEYDDDSQHSEHRPPLVNKPVLFEITMHMPHKQLARRLHLRDASTRQFRRYFQRSIERLEDDHELDDVEDVFEHEFVERTRRVKRLFERPKSSLLVCHKQSSPAFRWTD